jgi:flagellar hook-basal body complex protein FliE
MAIAPIERLIPGLHGVAPGSLKQGVAPAGFGDALSKALAEVSNTQKASGALSKAFLSDDPTVSLERVMVAGVKSGIAFQATLQVRNKMVQAYSDIMNMQI